MKELSRALTSVFLAVAFALLSNQAWADLVFHPKDSAKTINQLDLGAYRDHAFLAHRVKKGETLAGIAKKVLGSEKRASQIVELNPELEDKGLIVGRQIVLPPISEQGAGKHSWIDPKTEERQTINVEGFHFYVGYYRGRNFRPEPLRDDLVLQFRGRYTILAIPHRYWPHFEIRLAEGLDVTGDSPETPWIFSSEPTRSRRSDVSKEIASLVYRILPIRKIEDGIIDLGPATFEPAEDSKKKSPVPVALASSALVGIFLLSHHRRRKTV